MPSVSITAHGNGYRIVWREGGRGSKRHWGETRSSKKDAAADADAMRARLLAEGELRNRITLPWGEVAIRWSKSRKAGRYVDESLRYLESLGWQTVTDATPAALAAMPPGRQRVVKAALRWAERMLDQPAPRRTLALPIPRTPRKAARQLVNDAEVSRIQVLADGFCAGTGALVHLLATYGHRAESLVGLRCSAYDPSTRHLTLAVKGGDAVRHPVIDATHVRLVAMQQRPAKPKDEPDRPLLPNHLGKAWETGRAFASWYHGEVGAGYYDLKRWAITRMLAAGLDARTVASITGHRTVSLLLNTYARTNETRQRAAIDALSNLSQVSAK